MNSYISDLLNRDIKASKGQRVTAGADILNPERMMEPTAVPSTSHAALEFQLPLPLPLKHDAASVKSCASQNASRVGRLIELAGPKTEQSSVINRARFAPN
jgi:hypothetical protein